MKLPPLRSVCHECKQKGPKVVFCLISVWSGYKIVSGCALNALNCTKVTKDLSLYIFSNKALESGIRGLLNTSFSSSACSDQYFTLAASMIAASALGYMAYNVAKEIRKPSIPVPPPMPARQHKMRRKRFRGNPYFSPDGPDLIDVLLTLLTGYVLWLALRWV